MPYPKPPSAPRSKSRGRKIYEGRSSRSKSAAAKTIQAAVRKVLARNMETKKSNSSATDNTAIGHNSFAICDSEVLATTQGTTDPQSGGTANRIGDEINLKGIAFKMMLENNNRYSDVTFRIMVIKSAKGDTPTTATLFNGLSGNKMLDTFNNERYTLIFSKYVKVKQGNAGSDGTLGAGFIGSGLYSGNTGLTQSASTKIVKFYIPGYKFVRKGVVRYENATDQVKFYDYNVLVYAYAVGATSQEIGWNVGVLNEYIKIMYFKDA